MNNQEEDKSIKGKEASRPQSGKFLRRFILFLVLLPLTFILLLKGLNLAGKPARAMLDIFDIGILLIVFAAGIVTWRLGHKKLAPLLERLGNKLKVWAFWAGIVLLGLALFGSLSFFSGEKGLFGENSLGGRFGMRILGGRDFIGLLRLLFLLTLGLVLIRPRISWNIFWAILSKSWLWYKNHPLHISLYRLFVKKPKTLPASQENKNHLYKPTEEKEGQLAEPAVELQPASTADKAPESISTGSQKDKRASSPEAPKVTAAAASEPKKALKEAARHLWKSLSEKATIDVTGWQLPSLDILESHREIEFKQVDNERRARLIEEALSSYGVEARVVQINQGPTVTQFGVEPGWDYKYKEIKEKDKNGNVKVRQEAVPRTRVKVDRITSLANDLALALSAMSVRIEAPVPGKSVVGIEVPNTSYGVVSLRSVIESTAFQKARGKSKLAIAMGKGAGGEAVVGELDKMPHLLIAGTTGSGKTVCLNSIISCLLMNNSPEDLRFIMIDPKRVEMTIYNSIPHLITPVIVETEKSLEILRWLNAEMDNRYKKMSSAGSRNIVAYNKERSWRNPLPYVILVIDELADLMMAQGIEVEQGLCRLAQLARATGIHLVVATQRPSVDVVTGLIKANFPTRISFAVASQVDSRTILDGVGAEKLLGRGDMLYLPVDSPKPKRLQGCYVSDAETETLVHFWSNQKGKIPSPEMDLLTVSSSASLDEQEDLLLEEARKLSREHPSISASFLQRKLRIGLPRATKLMERLEKETRTVDSKR